MFTSATNGACNTPPIAIDTTSSIVIPSNLVTKWELLLKKLKAEGRSNLRKKFKRCNGPKLEDEVKGGVVAVAITINHVRSS
ncbi:hypothetical protein AALP_AA7G069800 [Arabis alpina]|uniref:Uncharacterized protein n=1 Tax=Arabis alpina TaxID=50452 RepID=A0A087GGE9_ARAAL|nr:hypothetical protein AALP_AA7G069800 [Arabis alpina]